MVECAEKTLRKICLLFEDCNAKPPGADALLSDEGITSLWQKLEIQLRDEGSLDCLEISATVQTLFAGDSGSGAGRGRAGGVNFQISKRHLFTTSIFSLSTFSHLQLMHVLFVGPLLLFVSPWVASYGCSATASQ